MLGLDKLLINPLKKFSLKAGTSPGTITFLEEPKISRVSVYAIDYDNNNFEEVEIADLKDVEKYKNSEKVTWIKVVGLSNVEILQSLGRQFGVHPLALEDVGNTSHKPKLDVFDDYLFIIARALRYLAESEQVLSEQVSMVIGAGYVITFQQHDDLLFENVKNRIKTARGRIRQNGADYLAYALLDTLVDHYLVILENLGDYIEDMQTRLIAHPNKQIFGEIYQARKEILLVRKAVFPLRDMMLTLQKEEITLIGDSTTPFIRDLQDHVVLSIESIDEFSDTIRGMLDLYYSSLSNQMNDVMRVLTIIATIFIPLTFIAGVYGMNFEYMPELSWRYGYFGSLGVMAVIGILMMIYFKRKKWF